jgi:phosphoribosylaminoimidazole carboxylase PurE protein
MTDSPRPRCSAQVTVVMGSKSDLPLVRHTLDVLKAFHVEYETRVLSAHRVPEQVARYAKEARSRGIRVIIAAAGGAAHLAGAVAAHTTLPVIGVPVPGEHLGGLDSLLSTVQMPSGIPVATVAVGEAGARNAALLAIEIMALTDAALLKRLDKHREDLAHKVETADREVRQE